MAYVPHLRVSMLGRLGGAAGPEQFSMSFSMTRDQGFGGFLLEPNQAVWQDIADDISAWFGHADTAIHPAAVLTSVKVATIGADGRYTAAPVEIPRNTPGAVEGIGRPANQDAYVVTLGTAADLGRVKGRFYVPLPSWGIDLDGRVNSASIEVAEARALQLINDINNAPGIDVLGLEVAVASQGRRDSFGAIRVPAGNHRVTSVAVGRVIDTQRRRRNKLVEAKTPRAVANPD